MLSGCGQEWIHSAGAADPWRLGSAGFPAGSQEIPLSWRWLNQPFRQTQQQPADLSLLVVSPVSKIRLLQRVVSCCIGVFILQFPPLSLFFSVSHEVRIPSLWQNESPNKGCFFHTDPIPTELFFSIGFIGAALGSSFSGLN